MIDHRYTTYRDREYMISILKDLDHEVGIDALSVQSGNIGVHSISENHSRTAAAVGHLACNSKSMKHTSKVSDIMLSGLLTNFFPAAEAIALCYPVTATTAVSVASPVAPQSPASFQYGRTAVAG